MIQQNVSLLAHNTLHFDEKAQYLLPITDEKQILPAVQSPTWRHERVRVLGGGSNVVLTQNLEGLVLLMQNQGKSVEKHADGYEIRVCAGENWHDFVMWCVAHGYDGLENLALIPGTVGAAPVQNIGAYGLEVSDRVKFVKCFDRKQNQYIVFSKEDCQFSYRESRFKKDPERYIITQVHFFLPKNWQPNLNYKELHDEFVVQARPVSAQAISAKVIQIRQTKLPDPNELGNVGSFFQNPVISKSAFEQLKKEHPNVVFYPQTNQVKLAAGWLIDQCGWKGHTEQVGSGRIGVHAKQALVLVHYGGANGGDLLNLVERIQHSVLERFHVLLKPEPVIW